MGRPVALVLALVLAASPAARASAQPWHELLTGPREAARLESSSASDRRDAAIALGRFGEPRRAVAVLGGALASERDPEVRRAIVESLARRGDPSGVPALVEALRERDGRDRASVAAALGAIGSDAAIRALVAALEDRAIAPAASQALVSAGASAVPHLLRALGTPARIHAIRALGAIGAPSATAHLVPLLADSAEDVRVATLEALGAIGDPRAARSVSAMTNDARPRVAAAAIRALGRLDGPGALPIARQALERSDASLRREALRALVVLDPAATAPVLADAVTAHDPVLGPVAIELALASPHPALVALQYGLLREGTRASAAADALAEVEGGAGVPVLMREVRSGGAARPAIERALAIAVRRWSSDLPGDVVDEAHGALRASEEGGEPRTLVLRAVARDESAGRGLAARLASDDPRDRAAAALGLELLGDRAWGDAIERALVRERDAEAFRRLASAALATGVRVSPAVLTTALVDEATAPEALALAAAAGREMSFRQLRRRGEILRSSLRSNDARTRAGAARAIAIAGERGAWRALVARLDDAAPEVRRAAARALEVLRVPEARAAIAARARIEEDAAVRDALGDAASAHERRPLGGFDAVGDQVLRLRIVAAAGETERGVPVDLVLPDGRWLRMRTLPTGELVLPDLPAGDADLRVRLEDRDDEDRAATRAAARDEPAGTR